AMHSVSRALIRGSRGGRRERAGLYVLDDQERHGPEAGEGLHGSAVWQVACTRSTVRADDHQVGVLATDRVVDVFGGIGLAMDDGLGLDALCRQAPRDLGDVRL